LEHELHVNNRARREKMVNDAKIIPLVRPIETPVVREQPPRTGTQAEVPQPRVDEQAARGAVAFAPRVNASRFADPREGRVLSALEGTSIEQLNEGRNTFVSGAEALMRDGRIS
jgi:hypothetical protein